RRCRAPADCEITVYSAQAGTWLDLLSLTKERANVQIDPTFLSHPGRSVAGRDGHRVGGCDWRKGKSSIQDDSRSQFREDVPGGRAGHADGAPDVGRKTDAARRGGCHRPW